ncbi:carboxy terminal-processing peptidase, partial [bacterium]|nr:carboxy terminal-processing peptidase [bacterium]
VPMELVNQLRKKSAKRVANDEDFADLLRRVELYVDQKDQETVSLEEETFLARRKELDSRKEEEEELEQQIEDAVIFRENYYNTEVMNVVADYIEGLRKQNLAKAN